MTEIAPRDIFDHLTDPRLEPVARRVLGGERLGADDALAVFETSDLLAVGRLATVARCRASGRVTWYIVNHHINYSNVCENRCRFCAFRRRSDEPGAYTMSLAEILTEADAVPDSGATELHIVGGLHPELGFDFYVEMIGRLHERLPQVHLQALTAVEIAHLAGRAGLSTAEVLVELRRAGLGSLPGGGAEVFADRVRRAACPDKLPADDWLRVMREAHELGMPSNATMLYGHIETAAERVEHLLRLRELQDETGGFMSFIPLAFHPANTELATSGEVRPGGTTAMDDLRTIAAGRLVLDNFPHVKSFWIMLGLGVAQVSQHFGADDLDGTVVRERITHAAGATTPEAMDVTRLRELIEEAGFEPRERNTVYRRVERDGAAWRLV